MDEQAAHRAVTRGDPDWDKIATFCDSVLPRLHDRSERFKMIIGSISRSSRELDKVVDGFTSISAYARRASGMPPGSAIDWASKSRESNLQLDFELGRFLADAEKLASALARHSVEAAGLLRGRTDHVLSMAEEILADAYGEPIYYKQLADEIRRRGGPLPESDRSAYETLIRMMNADSRKRFMRPFQRGYYALAKDYPNTRNVGVRHGGKASASS